MLSTLTRPALLALLALPAGALAGDVAVAPLFPTSASEQQSANVTALISSELDFSPEFDRMNEVERGPTNAACLASTRCLAGLAVGHDNLVTGTLAVVGGDFELDLVFFDAAGGRLVRRQTFTVSKRPEAVADGMNAIVRELVTGVAPAEVVEAEPSVADFDFTADEDDDFSFEDDGAEEARAAAAEARRAEEERLRAAEEERRRAEEERLARARRLAAEEEARREAEAARRRAEEEARRRRAEEQAREEARLAAEARRAEEARAAAEMSTDDAAFDPNAIHFAAAADQISAETIDAAIQFAPASSAGTVEDDTTIALDELDVEDDFLFIEDLDEPSVQRGGTSTGLVDLDGPVDSRRERTRSSRSTRTPSRTPSSAPRPRDTGERGPYAVQITARAGYSRYFVLDFVTYGAEIGVPIAGSPLNFLVGAEAYSTQRTLPDEIAALAGSATEWNTMFPFNAGFLYKADTGGTVFPYFGADVIGGQYYIDDTTNTGSWAVGGRARGGLDWMVARSFGLNVNLSVGAWHGKRWRVIEEGIDTAGLLPQVSAGTVFAF